MEAGKHTVKQLFQKDIRYVIPTFQRPYVWSQTNQWDPLWEDVRNLAERYSEELEATGNQAEAEKLTGTHFMGAVVLQQIPTATSDIERRDVIDGQQRMTTLQILLDAAQEVMETEGYAREAKRLRKLVLNDEDFAEGDLRFKLWPTLGDRDAFRAAMTNGQSVEGHEHSLVAQAHRYFSEQVRHWLKTDGATRAPALHTALNGLLELVVIDLRTGDDAYVIFETLNARGTPLLASDLVKNFVLQKASSDGFPVDQIHKEYWVEFESDWWRKDVRQGRIVRPRVDVFLNYWLVARSKKEVSSQRVFPAFRDYVLHSTDAINTIVADISSAGKTYRSFDAFEAHSIEGTFLYRWRVVQAGVLTPLLLDLFSASENLLSVERRSRALRALESFLVRRTVCRMTTKDYNRLFLELGARLDGKIGVADDVIVHYLAGQTADSRLWPSNESVAKAMLEMPLYRLLTRARLRMVLESLEDASRSDKAEEAHALRGRLTIEHVLPQTWKTHWALEVGDDPEEYLRRVARRDNLKHTIGNLTLVTNKLNPALSNGAWESKAEGLLEHSTLQLNSDLLKRYSGREFAESQILERGRTLADLACTVWMAPPVVDQGSQV